MSAGGQSWVIRRTHANFILLDEQLHRCVWDRSFSRLELLKESLSGGDCDGVAPLSSASISNKGNRQGSSSCANINAATSAAAAAAASRRRTTSAGGGAAGACEDLVGEDAPVDQLRQNNRQQQQSDRPDEEHVGATHKYHIFYAVTSEFIYVTSFSYRHNIRISHPLVYVFFAW